MMKRATIKHTFIYLLPAALLCLNGCVKTQRNPDTYFSDKGYPLGTFEGTGLKLRKKAADYKFDTVKINLKLVLSTNTGYSLTGDTTTWHAGSYGSFAEDVANMIFDDLTYSSKSTSKKAHLSGLYTYDYGGNTLIITPAGIQSDTLRYLYIFKKVY